MKWTSDTARGGNYVGIDFHQVSTIHAIGASAVQRNAATLTIEGTYSVWNAVRNLNDGPFSLHVDPSSRFYEKLGGMNPQEFRSALYNNGIKSFIEKVISSSQGIMIHGTKLGLREN